jgi:hypothetical protein
MQDVVRRLEAMYADDMAMSGATWTNENGQPALSLLNRPKGPHLSVRESSLFVLCNALQLLDGIMGLALSAKAPQERQVITQAQAVQLGQAMCRALASGDKARIPLIPHYGQVGGFVVVARPPGTILTGQLATGTWTALVVDVGSSLGAPVLLRLVDRIVALAEDCSGGAAAYDGGAADCRGTGERDGTAQSKKTADDGVATEGSAVCQTAPNSGIMAQGGSAVDGGGAETRVSGSLLVTGGVAGVSKQTVSLTLLGYNLHAPADLPEPGGGTENQYSGGKGKVTGGSPRRRWAPRVWCEAPLNPEVPALPGAWAGGQSLEMLGIFVSAVFHFDVVTDQLDQSI